MRHPLHYSAQFGVFGLTVAGLRYWVFAETSTPASIAISFALVAVVGLLIDLIRLLRRRSGGPPKSPPDAG